ncbi:TPA: hypothetical protein N0F65_001500 [Lagenidium giganteum]|uniref:Rab-GAP TBC domain-containing protein n=1 Tax=Lagenidium giganteum TaxID=4803 RepID=A0AAV2Z6M4_9STRA|nr:TPA: hypothetical protein N0F65_001500 [Lagenidium giganteum]
MMLKSSVSFNQYVQRSATLLSPEFEEDQRQIDLDVPRAVLSICDFVLGHAVSSEDNVPSELVEPIMPRIRNVLVAFSVRNPSVGYVQGHADVVCFLLGKGTATCDEEQAFWLYVCVMERVFPHDFFARSPRLHGFHVPCGYNNLSFGSCLCCLVVMPTQIDLLLVCSLLACKWFVSLWVGELSTDVLVQVWDTMLTEPSGSVFHLLLGLEMFSLTLDDAKDRFHTTPDEFNSSLVYKLVQTKARGIAHVDARRILANAQTLYGINEEALEDMRSNVRREPRLRHAELVVLGRHTHFSMVELARFHDEFLFLRYFSKTCDRNKLRGLRLEHFEGVIARHFPCSLMQVRMLLAVLRLASAGILTNSGNAQILSTMSRGSPEERLQLLFRCSGITDDGNFPDALGSISALSGEIQYCISALLGKQV